MRTFRLELPWPLHPLWVKDVQQLGVFDGKVEADGTVSVMGQRLSFGSSEVPPPGTDLKIWLTGFLSCSTVRDYNLHQQWVAAREAMNLMEELKRPRQPEIKKLEAAKAFAEQYSLPFEWVAAIKERRTAITPESSGASAATVVHVLVKKPFKQGRLARQVDEFLCEHPGQKGNWNISGKAYEGLPTMKTEEGLELQQAVTCKQCLALASRWQAEHQK